MSWARTLITPRIRDWGPLCWSHSLPPGLKALTLHEKILSQGCYSPDSRVQSVLNVNGDNGPKNRPEGQGSSTLPRSACSLGGGGSLVSVGVFLQGCSPLPLDTQKSYFSLFKTWTGRISCLPSLSGGKFVFPGRAERATRGWLPASPSPRGCCPPDPTHPACPIPLLHVAS